MIHSPFSQVGFLSDALFRAYDKEEKGFIDFFRQALFNRVSQNTLFEFHFGTAYSLSKNAEMMVKP